jgi:hypothetical protein
MILAEAASHWTSADVVAGGYGAVMRVAMFAIIPIVFLVRVQRGRTSPRSRYTPPPHDPDTGQDLTESGLTGPSGTVTGLPRPEPALPTFSYGIGQPPATADVVHVPRPPAPAYGLPQFVVPPPAAVPGTVPELVAPDPDAAPTVVVPAGLPARGVFCSQASRIQYAVSLFITAAVLALIGGGPGLILDSFGSRAFVAGGWVLDGAAVVALVLTVRSLRVGITYDADGVVARGILRTSRWAWAQLGEFQIETTRSNAPIRLGASGVRKMLRVEEVDGRVSVLRALVAQRGGPSDPSWLDEAASMLNAQVRARHRG